MLSSAAHAQSGQCTSQLCWQIEPTVCVSDNSASPCPLTFSLHWQSKLPAAVCAELAGESLKCWTNQSAGELTHQTLLTEPLLLQLSINGEIQLRQQLSLLSRQPARRKRLVAPWSVF